MSAEERRQRITEILAAKGFVSLADLAIKLGVSESTLRRDLDSLDRAGIVRRTHGGAMSTSESTSIPAFEDRSAVSAAEKRQIGVAAAELIRDGDTVLLDGGTTTFEVARRLAGRAVQVVTNSIPIAHLLAGDRHVDLTMIGGYVYPRTGVAVGSLANQFLDTVHAQRLIMSVAGITERGLFNSNTLLAEMQMRMMQVVDEIVVVADHTKFGQRSVAHVCGLDHVHRVVSDEQLAPEQRQVVEAAGVQLTLAPGGTE